MVVLGFYLLFLAQQLTTQVVAVAQHMAEQDLELAAAAAAALAAILILTDQTELPIVVEVVAPALNLITLVVRAALES
jgi:hypothetical protein